jgi:c(7)-type cytochrome triheme protein
VSDFSIAVLVRRSIVLRAISVAFAVTSCSTAASVLLDVPQQRSDGEGPTRAAVTTMTVDVDTLRPPIEATLDPEEVLALLPRDEGGYVDWVTALREGIIDPRRSLPGQEDPAPMDGFRFDFKLKGPAPMFDADFPHTAHVEWLACESCHSRIFEYRNELITMEAVNNGEACGECHGTVAFPAVACNRCHKAMPPSGGHTPTFTRDITLARTTDSTELRSGAEAFPPAQFAHWVHRIRYRCTTCHPALFEAQAGANTITMADLNARRACGACHDGRTAFGTLQCTRCHISPESDPSDMP